MAFNERNIGFSFISALIFSHWLAYIVWQLVFLRARNSPKSLEEGLLDMATERVLSAESLAWEISLLLTGVALLYQHVVTKPCAQVCQNLFQMTKRRMVRTTLGLLACGTGPPHKPCGPGPHDH